MDNDPSQRASSEAQTGLAQFLSKFDVRGVFWRQYMDWGVARAPAFLEPMMIGFYSLFFYLCAVEGRKGIHQNLTAIFPDSSRLRNHLRGLRVVWNFSWTLVDTARFRTEECKFGWEFENPDLFDAFTNHPEGVILLTAHMGNYDLGGYLFNKKVKSRITVVRAPETMADTQEYVSRTTKEDYHTEQGVQYSGQSETDALELVRLLRDNKIVAIQGDRIVGGMTAGTTEMFGKKIAFPIGPFILAMVSRTPIYPLFIVRTGYRQYRIITSPPIKIDRRAGSRDEILRKAMNDWAQALEPVLKQHWHQWFAFSPQFTLES